MAQQWRTYPVDALMSRKTKNPLTQKVETSWVPVTCELIELSGKGPAPRNRIPWVNRNWFWDQVENRTFIVDPEEALHQLLPQRRLFLEHTPLSEDIIDSILLPYLDDYPYVGAGYLAIVRESIAIMK